MKTRIRYKKEHNELRAILEQFNVSINTETLLVKLVGPEFQQELQARTLHDAKKKVKNSLQGLGIMFGKELRKHSKESF